MDIEQTMQVLEGGCAKCGGNLKTVELGGLRDFLTDMLLDIRAYVDELVNMDCSKYDYEAICATLKRMRPATGPGGTMVIDFPEEYPVTVWADNPSNYERGMSVMECQKCGQKYECYQTKNGDWNVVVAAG